MNYLQCASDVAGLLFGAAAVILTVRVIGHLVRYVWLPDAVRDVVERAGSLVGVVAVLAYIAFGFLVIFEREELFAWILLGVFTVGVLFAWAPLYDLVCGVAFRISRVCRLGDHVRVGQVEGRVVGLGTRVLVVRTRSGDEVVLYYGKIVQVAFRRTQSLAGAHVHSFRVDAPRPSALADFRRLVTDAALRCHWSSVVHAPRFEAATPGQLEISVFALHHDYAPLVEAAVRLAIENSKNDRGSAGPAKIPKPPA